QGALLSTLSARAKSNTCAATKANSDVKSDCRFGSWANGALVERPMGIHPASRRGAAARHHTDGSHLACVLSKPKSRFGDSLLRELHWTRRGREIPAGHGC